MGEKVRSIGGVMIGIVTPRAPHKRLAMKHGIATFGSSFATWRLRLPPLVRAMADSEALVRSMPPLKRAPGVLGTGAAPPLPHFGAASALRSELQALRTAEGRLDALLDGEPRETVERAPVLHLQRPAACAVPQVAAAKVASPPEATRLARSDAGARAGPPIFPHRGPVPQVAHQVTAAAVSTPGAFVFDLSLDRYFAAWCAACAEMRAYWRQRRNDNSRKWLGTRSSALALWSFFCSLRCHVDQPLQRPSRGIRVREKQTHFSGTFFSCSDRGICKILLDGDREVCFRAAEALWEIVALPHPFLAGLAFLAWTLSHAQDEDLKIDGLRTALMFNQVMGKSSGKLTMLAVMQEEAAKGLKFCFGAWKKAMKSKSLKKFTLNRQRELFRAWLEILLMEKHDRAIETLDSTRSRLSKAGQLRVKRNEQCLRIKVKLEKMHFLRLGFFNRLILQSWQMLCIYRRAQEEGKKSARQKLALSSLQLSEVMSKKTTASIMPHFQAWVARARHAKRLTKAAEGTIATMLGGSLSVVFRAWKMMKMSDYQKVAAQLQSREREFNELSEISRSFFAFSQDQGFCMFSQSKGSGFIV